MKIVNKTIHLVFLFICTAFLFYSCENFFSPVKAAEKADPAPVVEEGSGKTGLVKISLNSDSSRTIFPDTPVFEQYRFEFTGPGTKDPIIDSSSIQTVSLAEGEWKITAYGRVTINNVMTDVASGNTTVNVASGGTAAAVIRVSSGIGGDNGKFSWSLSAPQGVEADSWSVTMKKYKTSDDPVINEGGEHDFSSALLNKSGEVDCAPGYYLVNMRVQNDLQSASRTEIVLIQSGLVSTMNCSFTADDFVKLITLSGTVSLTLGSEPIPVTNCMIILKSENGEEISSTRLESDNSWTMSVESREEDTPAKFSVSASIEGALRISCTFDDTYTIKNSDITDIELEKEFISVGGTLVITESNEPLTDYGDWVITATITETSYYVSRQTNGNWMFLVEAQAEPVPVSFTLRNYDSGKEYVLTGDWKIHNESVYPISLEKNFSSETFSGSLIAGNSGIDLTKGKQFITVRESSVYDFESFRGGQKSEVDEEGYWAYSITVDNPSSFYVFAIIFDEDFYIQSVYRMEDAIIKEPIMLSEYNLDLSEMEKVTCTISGTLAGLEEERTYSLYSCSVPVIEEGGYLPGPMKASRGPVMGGNTFVSVTNYGDCEVTDGIWSMAIPLSQTDYDVFFCLYIDGDRYMTIIPVKAGSEDQSDITIDIENMVIFESGVS